MSVMYANAIQLEKEASVRKRVTATSLWSSRGNFPPMAFSLPSSASLLPLEYSFVGDDDDEGWGSTIKGLAALTTFSFSSEEEVDEEEEGQRE